MRLTVTPLIALQMPAAKWLGSIPAAMLWYANFSSLQGTPTLVTVLAAASRCPVAPTSWYKVRDPPPAAIPIHRRVGAWEARLEASSSAKPPLRRRY
jgi:hypothetical protein